MDSAKWAAGLGIGGLAVASLMYGQWASEARRVSGAAGHASHAGSQPGSALDSSASDERVRRAEAELVSEKQQRIALEQALERQKQQFALALQVQRQRMAASPQGGGVKPETTARAILEDNDDAWHLRPIGYVQSCYLDCQGTPRQPGLAPAARARIRLDKSISELALEGLDLHSHVWVLFVFHKNSNGANVGRRAQKGYTFPAKIFPPRAGKKVGCLATRTPHRPNPVGLRCDGPPSATSRPCSSNTSTLPVPH